MKMGLESASDRVPALGPGGSSTVTAWGSAARAHGIDSARCNSRSAEILTYLKPRSERFWKLIFRSLI